MRLYGQCTVNSLFVLPPRPAHSMTGLMNITGCNAAQSLIGLRLDSDPVLGDQICEQSPENLALSPGGHYPLTI